MDRQEYDDSIHHTSIGSRGKITTMKIRKTVAVEFLLNYEM